MIRHFRVVDRAIREAGVERNLPLVLAGVEELLPLFRQVSEQEEILEEAIEGNPDHMKPEEVHRRGWAIVEPLFRRRQDESLARFRELEGTGRASRDFREVLLAAFHKRVERLSVAMRAERWGRVDPQEGTVEFGDEETPGHRELVEAAAMETILNGGIVEPVEPERMPEGAILAAIFRF